MTTQTMTPEEITTMTDEIIRTHGMTRFAEMINAAHEALTQGLTISYDESRKAIVVENETANAA